MLTQTLRSLERCGLVERRVYAEVPPRVDHSLTLLGGTLIEPLDAIRVWAEAHIDEIHRAEGSYDHRSLP